MRLAGKIIEPVFNESVNLQQNDNLPHPTLNSALLTDMFPPSSIISITYFRNFQRLNKSSFMSSGMESCFSYFEARCLTHTHLAVRLSFPLFLLSFVNKL